MDGLTENFPINSTVNIVEKAYGFGPNDKLLSSNTDNALSLLSLFFGGRHVNTKFKFGRFSENSVDKKYNEACDVMSYNAVTTAEFKKFKANTRLMKYLPGFVEGFPSIKLSAKLSVHAVWLYFRSSQC